MKKVVIGMVLVSSLIFAFGGSRPKYKTIETRGYFKVNVGGQGCRKYIHVNMKVKGEKRDSKNFRNSYAHEWLRFGSATSQCGGVAYASKLTLGQVSYSNNNYFSRIGIFNNKASATVNFDNYSSSKSRGLRGRFITILRNRQYDNRLTVN